MFPENLNILLIENPKGVAEYFIKALEDIKIPYTLTTTGEVNKILDYVTRTSVPCIIFLVKEENHLSNPKNTLDIIRSEERLNRVPVVIFSKNNDDAALKDLYRAGANVFMYMPHKPKDLTKTLKNMLRIHWQYVIDGLDMEQFIMKY